MKSDKEYSPGEELFSKQQIDRRVAAMGRKIARDFEGEELVVLVVLKGAMYFATGLTQNMPRDIYLDFIQISSYGREEKSSGVVRFLMRPRVEMKDKNVLIIEDIIDTGVSMNRVVPYIKRRGAKRVVTAALLDKPAKRVVPFEADYVGFTIPPRFVVGSGLDSGERYRNVRGIRALD